jgi:hypothetical protein
MSLSELFTEVESYGGYCVEPFEGAPWDEELLEASGLGRYWPGS